MFKVLKYLKQSLGYVLCIILLLFLQAYCDLSLPDYTSRIVNVGIQQQGIENGVPDKIRVSSMEQLFVFMDEKDQSEVEDAYNKEGDIYKIKKDVSEEKEEWLNEIFGAPMLMAQQLSQDSEQTELIRKKLKLPQDADLLQAISQLPQDAKAQMFQEVKDQISQMPESIVTQTAVTYVRSEYEQMGEDVDQIQITYILRAGIQMVGLALVIMLAAVSVTFLSARVAATLGHDLRNAVYRKVVGFSGAEYNRFSTASLITRSTNDIQQIQLMTAMIFRIALYAPILGIGGVLKVVKTDVSMSWIIALAVVLILIVIGLLFKIAMPKFTKLQYLIDRLNLVTREILMGIPVIRAFSREKFEEERFEGANQKLTRTNLFVNRCMTFMMPTMMLIMNGFSVMIVFFGSKAVDAGTMQVGNMMAFIQYSMQIIMAFLMICMMSIMLPRADVAAKRINEVLETTETILDPDQPKQPEESQRGTVQFDHVSFTYPGASEKILRDISFTAERGQTVAFIGSTGSGKSSLVNTFGVTASAGVGVAEKVCVFLMLVSSAYMHSMSAFVAQNMGAGQPRRAKRALGYGILTAFAAGLVMAWLAVFHGDTLSLLFAKDAAVAAASHSYLKAYAIDCMLTPFLFCFMGYYNGCEKTLFVMIQGIIGAFGVRIPIAYLVSRIPGATLFQIGLGTPASSTVQIVLCLAMFLYLERRQRREALCGAVTGP